MASKQQLEKFKKLIATLLATSETILTDVRRRLALRPDKVGDFNYVQLEINEAYVEGEIKVLESHLARVNTALEKYEE